MANLRPASPGPGAPKKKSYEVDCAFHLAETHEKLLTHPGLIFLDNNLPNGMGQEYLQMNPLELWVITW